MVVVCLTVFRRWVRVLLEHLDMSVSHSCAWTWTAMTIVCACVGRDLYVVLCGEFSLKDTGRAISARVRVWKLTVMLITMGIIWTWSLFSVMSHYGKFEWPVYVMYVGYGVESVAIRGVRTLYEL